MEIRPVQYFLLLCQEGNFTRAAKLCRVSQPSLTNAIKALERQCGAPLFVRKPAPVRPTELGLLLKPLFEQIDACARQIRKQSVQFTGGPGEEPALAAAHSAKRNGNGANTRLRNAAMRKVSAHTTVEGQASQVMADAALSHS